MALLALRLAVGLLVQGAGRRRRQLAEASSTAQLALQVAAGLAQGGRSMGWAAQLVGEGAADCTVVGAGSWQAAGTSRWAAGA